MFHWNWARIFWSLCSAGNVFLLYWLAGFQFEKGQALALAYALALVVYALAYGYPGPMPGESIYHITRRGMR